MEKVASRRSSNGQFLPGFYGKPGGRPKGEFNVAELERSYTLEAVETLVDLMRGIAKTIERVERPLRRS